MQPVPSFQSTSEKFICQIPSCTAMVNLLALAILGGLLAAYFSGKLRLSKKALIGISAGLGSVPFLSFAIKVGCSSPMPPPSRFNLTYDEKPKIAATPSAHRQETNLPTNSNFDRLRSVLADNLVLPKKSEALQPGFDYSWSQNGIAIAESEGDLYYIFEQQDDDDRYLVLESNKTDFICYFVDPFLEATGEPIFKTEILFHIDAQGPFLNDGQARNYDRALFNRCPKFKRFFK